MGHLNLLLQDAEEVIQEEVTGDALLQDAFLQDAFLQDAFLQDAEEEVMEEEVMGDAFLQDAQEEVIQEEVMGDTCSSQEAVGAGAANIVVQLQQGGREQQQDGSFSFGSRPSRPSSDHSASFGSSEPRRATSEEEEVLSFRLLETKEPARRQDVLGRAHEPPRRQEYSIVPPAAGAPPAIVPPAAGAPAPAKFKSTRSASFQEDAWGGISSSSAWCVLHHAAEEERVRGPTEDHEVSPPPYSTASATFLFAPEERERKTRKRKPPVEEKAGAEGVLSEEVSERPNSKNGPPPDSTPEREPPPPDPTTSEQEQSPAPAASTTEQPPAASATTTATLEKTIKKQKLDLKEQRLKANVLYMALFTVSFVLMIVGISAGAFLTVRVVPAETPTLLRFAFGDVGRFYVTGCSSQGSCGTRERGPGGVGNVGE